MIKEWQSLMPARKSAYILLAITTSMLFLLWSCVEPISPPFSVGIATWPGFAPGYIAQEKGFFDDLKVEFSILDDFTVRQSAFTSKKNLATISTLDSFAFESGKGVQGKAFMILDESFGADGIVVNSKIKIPQDFKGRKVAYTRGSPAHFFLIEFLQKNDLTMNDIQRVEVDDPSRASQAFISGSVDAAVTWEPNITQIINSKKGRLIASTKTEPELIIDIMILNLDTFQNRKNDVRKFVDGWFRAIEFIKSNQEEAFSIMAKKLNIPQNEFPQIAKGLKYADKSRNKELLLPDGNSRAIQIFNAASKVWLDEKLITQAQEGSAVITSEFIERNQ